MAGMGQATLCPLSIVRVLLFALDPNSAILQERNQRTDCRDNWRQHYADDARCEWELSHRAPLVLNDDTAHIAFVDQRLYLVGRCFTLCLERFPVRLLFHDSPSVEATIPLI